VTAYDPKALDAKHPTHADLVAAAEKARRPYCPDCIDTYRGVATADHNAHVDDLLAILEVHYEIAPIYLGRGSTCACDDLWDECPTVQIVVDRLRGWGVL
jgi:hypothetical protein